MLHSNNLKFVSIHDPAEKPSCLIETEDRNGTCCVWDCLCNLGSSKGHVGWDWHKSGGSGITYGISKSPSGSRVTYTPRLIFAHDTATMFIPGCAVPTADLLSEPYIVCFLWPVSVHLINLPTVKRTPADPWQRDIGAIDARSLCKESRSRVKVLWAKVRIPPHPAIYPAWHCGEQRQTSIFPLQQP